ncbi:long-chain-fatty-acid--CoA ligase [Thermaurantiacus sp.]
MEFTRLSDMTAHWAMTTPERIAIRYEGMAESWASLHARVLAAAGALRKAGVKPGDRVGHMGLNHPAYVVLMCACFRLGAIMTPINWRLVAGEVAYVLQDAGIGLLLADRAFGSVIAGAGVTGLTIVWTEEFDAFLADATPDDSLAPSGPETIVLQLYTSGTTGFPKGALLTNRSLLGTIAKGALTGEAWSLWRDDDVALVAMPLFHIGGTGWALHALHAGATMVILPRPEIPAIVAAIGTHRVTRMFAVPAVLNMILNDPEGATADFSSVRALLYGASPIPLDVLSRSIARFPNAQFVQCYGATETSGTVVYLPPEDHSVEGNARMKGCGKPFPGNEIRIVDAEMRELPRGQIGEIAIRSVSVMAGYHNKPEATAKAIRDGWYLSGDAGVMDEDGYLYIQDRVKDMIVSGAENIYPAEVENALHTHPAVRDAAVIGVPDPKWGEAVKAIIVLKEGAHATADEIIAHCRPLIAGYKIPKSVDFVAELPRNPSGKILKKELRKPYWEGMDRQVA